MKNRGMFLILVLFYFSCSNEQKEIDKTINGIFKSIKDNDKIRFKNFFNIRDKSNMFYKLNTLYHDSISENSKPPYILKDTVIQLGGVLGRLEYEYIKIPYYDYQEGSKAAYTHLDFYIFFDKNIIGSYKKADSYRLKGIK